MRGIVVGGVAQIQPHSPQITLSPVPTPPPPQPQRMPLIPQRHRPPKRPPLPPFSIVFHPQRPTVQQRHPQRTLHNRLFGQIRKPFVAWVAGDAAVGGVHDEPSGVRVGRWSRGRWRKYCSAVTGVRVSSTAPLVEGGRTTTDRASSPWSCGEL